MAILIIEDEQSIAELQRDYLEINGFDVVIKNDGEEGLQYALNNDNIELAIVDIMLPSRNGFEICREIRKEKELPLLVVSAKASDIDKVRALGLGADDYIVKPFSPNEFVARVQAHIARYNRLNQNATKAVARPEVISIGALSINITAHTVEKNGVLIPMTNKEFTLLLYLMQNVDIVLSKEQILNRVWGVDSFVESATVAVHINRLREKIESDTSNPYHIQTVWGIGYRFVP